MKDLSEHSQRISTSNTSFSRPKTQNTASNRSATSIYGNNDFIRGERVSQTAMTPLSALYKSSYPRYPAFPSIYESKYSHDYKYTFWPAERCKREFAPPLDNSKFKFGKSHYTEEFPPKKPMKNKMITPISRHRLNNPQPRIHMVQDFPDAQRWIWSSPEKSNSKPETRLSTTAERVRKWQRSLEPQWHRWNSR